jgi:hypothetical protein
MMMNAIRSDPGVDLSLAEESNERGDRGRDRERRSSLLWTTKRRRSQEHSTSTSSFTYGFPSFSAHVCLLFA